LECVSGQGIGKRSKKIRLEYGIRKRRMEVNRKGKGFAGKKEKGGGGMRGA
jgi:hypothetical protein